MAFVQQNILVERDTEQAIKVLKKGTYLLKYGRRGKPKFCPFRLSSDEKLLIWYAGKEEKQLKLSHVSRICTWTAHFFQRYPQPEKEYQSFSLVYSNRSLDLICKDKDEAELWFTAIRTLISQDNHRISKSDVRSDSISSNSPGIHTQKSSPSHMSSTSHDLTKASGDTQQILVAYESSPQNRLGKAFSEVLSFTAAAKAFTRAESVSNSLNFVASGGLDDANSRSSTADSFRVSLSSAVSSSSQGSCQEDFEALGDVFIWGEGLGNGLLVGGANDDEVSSVVRRDALLPKVLESTVILDAKNIACGRKHAVLVTKQGHIFSWGDGSGGRLGHGVEADVSCPKLIDALSGSNIYSVACGEFHTCAVTLSGDLYTWGDGIHNPGLLGHANEISHWIPRKVSGQMEGLQVSSVSCGPWHTAATTTTGKLFTFGDGTFGALGHGDRSSSSVPREVETLKEFKTVMSSCGVWHTAAIVEISSETSGSSGLSSKRLFTWGNGDEGQLGHGDEETRLVPVCVKLSDKTSFCKVACGHSITIALTYTGQVYSMGSADYGQLGSPASSGKLPTRIEGNIKHRHIEEIACGSHHIAVVSSKSEIYTWGNGENGQLGHGDYQNKHTPTLVEGLRDKVVKNVVCGSNFTAIICLHKGVSIADQSVCSGCRNQFNFRRRRHNCYNCGLAFCKLCSSKKSLKTALAPEINKRHRVCDGCFLKLNGTSESGSNSRIPRNSSGSSLQNCNGLAEKGNTNSRSARRIMSFDSSKQAKDGQAEPKRNSGCASSSLNGIFHLESYSSFSNSNKISTSPPGSRMVCRPPSPITRKSCPAHSITRTSFTGLRNSEVKFDFSKQFNDNLNQEPDVLRVQMEDLSCRYQLLEVELERTSRKLKETTQIAQVEAEKNKAAQEVIRSLTAQLRDMAKGVPEHSHPLTRSRSHAYSSRN